MSSNYLKTFVIRRTLSHARSVQGRACSLPQIRVVGDQKSGKSSLLQCITGVHFPVKNGICMRAPTVVPFSAATVTLSFARSAASPALRLRRFPSARCREGNQQGAEGTRCSSPLNERTGAWERRTSSTPPSWWSRLAEQTALAAVQQHRA